MPTKLEPMYDSLDAVPEPFRDSYVEQDGKAVFSKPIEVESLPEVAGLKSAHAKVQRALKDAEQRLDRYKDVDPDKYAEALSELETLRAAKGGTKEEIDRALAQVRDGHAKEVRSLTEKLTAKEQRLQNREKDIAVNAALGKYETVSPAATKLLNRYIRDLITVAEDGDDYVVQVLDDNGKVAYSKKTGEPKTVAELVEEMANSPEYAALFKGTGASGGGAEGSKTPGRVIGGKRVVSKAQMEDRAFYKQMVAEAEKVGKHVMDYVTIQD